MTCAANSNEDFYRQAQNYCRDTPFSGALHPGKNCYREFGQATAGGDQVCFDAAGNCEDSYDRVDPADGRDHAGSCSLGLLRSIGHTAADIVPSLFRKPMRHTIVYIRRSDNAGNGGAFLNDQQLGASVLAGRHYSQAEVKGMLAQTGWPLNLIETMSAIVMGESSGYACAHNTSGENSVGLGQVNLNAHHQYTQEQMCDPIQNLTACYSIYRSQGFRAWGAYTNGSYRRYLGGGGAITPAGGQGTYDPATNTYNAGNIATVNVNTNDGLAAAAITPALAALGLLVLFVALD